MKRRKRAMPSRSSSSSKIVTFLLYAVMVFMILHPLSAEPSNIFGLAPVTDAIMTGVGITIFTGGLLLREVAQAPTGSNDFEALCVLDQMMRAGYSWEIDLISELSLYMSLFAPALLAFNREIDEIFVLGAMFMETVLIANGVKDTLKGLLPRYRPYMYGDSPPLHLVGESERYFAFPSGHTTMAFAGASFLAYVFLTWYPSSFWGIPIAAAGMLSATATAVLRVLAGQHFISDVLVGGVIGLSCGWIIPHLHRIRND